MRSTFSFSLQLLETSVVPFSEQFNTKKNTGTLFDASWTLNTLVYLFWDILTTKYVNWIYVVRISTLNTPTTPYLFVDVH